MSLPGDLRWIVISVHLAEEEGFLQRQEEWQKERQEQRKEERKERSEAISKGERTGAPTERGGHSRRSGNDEPVLHCSQRRRRAGAQRLCVGERWRQEETGQEEGQEEVISFACLRDVTRTLPSRCICSQSDYRTVRRRFVHAHCSSDTAAVPDAVSRRC